MGTVESAEAYTISNINTKKSLPFLSSGSTLLNLILSGKKDSAFCPGTANVFWGSSESGKTLFNLGFLAEAANSDYFKNYELIYDDLERRNLFNIEQLLGEKLAKRIKAPKYDKEGTPIFSDTIESFYYNLDDCLNRDKPIIYILDSMDSTTSDDEEEQFQEEKEAYQKGKTTSGTYGVSKAKTNSVNLRRAIHKLSKTNSILFIISQQRANLGFGFKKWIRSGGEAIRFYSCTEISSQKIKTIEKTVRGKKREVGTEVKLSVDKNSISGRKGDIEISIYPDYGIDNISSCINYLVDEGIWEKKGQTITPNKSEFFNEEMAGTLPVLVEFIESNSLEDKLSSLVEEVYIEILNLSSQHRKGRYE